MTYYNKDDTCDKIKEDGKIIERVYEIPKEEIKKRKSITITKNYFGKYEKFRIKDKEQLKKVDQTWKRIISK